MFSQESTVSEEGNYIIIEDDKGITVLDKTLLKYKGIFIK